MTLTTPMCYYMRVEKKKNETPRKSRSLPVLTKAFGDTFVVSQLHRITIWDQVQ